MLATNSVIHGNGSALFASCIAVLKVFKSVSLPRRKKRNWPSIIFGWATLSYQAAIMDSSKFKYPTAINLIYETYVALMFSN